jgi:hypothetical protein
VDQLMALPRSLLIVVLLSLSGCGVPEHEQWTEQVTLHDGRQVTVTRGAWQQWLFDGASGQAWRYRYSIKVPNPNSGQVVRWAGRWSEKPIIVEFDQRYAYVVLLPEKCDVDMTRYGNPNPPYVVMRRADGWFQRWKPIRLGDYPASLRSTNLMLRYPMWEIRDLGQTRFSADDVRRRSRPGQTMDAGFVQSPIPHDWESWNYQHKRRDGWGCADKYRKFVPDPGHPQSPTQPSQEVQLDILETSVYEPQWIAESNAKDPSRDWNVIAANDPECRSFLRSAGYDSDRPEIRGWWLFVKDPTGNKKARNAGALFCDAESLWFVDYYQPEDPSYVSVVKFTNSGDFKYRVRFAKPDAPRGYLGSIMGPTFRSESGFLYFEWWNFRHLGASEGGGVQIERSMKVRLREPTPAEPAN